MKQIKLKAARIIWLLFGLQSLISPVEIFKASCQFHVASCRAVDICSRWTPLEARQRWGWSGRKVDAVKRESEREGGGTREDECRRHSSSTGKRHDGISEIALDIFAYSVYIANRAVLPPLHSPRSSLHSHPFLVAALSELSRLKQRDVSATFGNRWFCWRHLDIAISILSLNKLA